MSSPMSRFGRIARLYRGVGLARTMLGTDLPCEFEIAHYQDGRILASCHMSSVEAFVVRVDAISELNGTVDNHYDLRAWRSCLIVAWNPGFALASGSNVSLILSFSEMQVCYSTESPLMAQYSIVNCVIDGSASGDKSLKFNINDHDTHMTFTMNRISSYTKTLLWLQLTKGVSITSRITTSVLDSDNSRSLDQTIDKVCDLLSAARGTKVTWMIREHVESHGRVVARYHRASITRPFHNFGPLPSTLDQHLPEYIRNGYSALSSPTNLLFAAPWLIDAFVDARTELDYIQSRGSKLAVFMEALKSASHATQTHEPGRKNNEAGSKDTRRKSHTSLFERLNSLFEEIAFFPDKAEIELFIKSRNALVHEGQFYVESRSSISKGGGSALPSVFDEYVFLLNFADRLMLHLLGYKNMYYDRRLFGRHPRPHRLVTDKHWPHPSTELKEWKPLTRDSDSETPH